MSLSVAVCPYLATTFLDNLLAYIQASFHEVDVRVFLITIVDAIQISFASVSDLHLEHLAFEVVCGKDLNVASVCVLKRIFE